MVRSLYAGISGLRSHQVALDVTGNNIANVNTVGFKGGRATFKESMAQLLQGASRPAGNSGGTNPLQIGLGTTIGSIDTMIRQGNLQTTGQITDLAIEGRAYFAFSSGNATFYSRNGGLQMDATGRLVSPTNGYALQGKMADALGNYPPGTVIGDIRIPWGEKSPAKATTQIDFQCNLNSDSEPLGTVTHTNRFLTSAGASYDSTFTTFALDSNGNPIRNAADDGWVMETVSTWSPGMTRIVADANGDPLDVDGNPITSEPATWPTLAREPVPMPNSARAVMTNLFDSNGNSLGIKEGDQLTVSWSDGDDTLTFPIGRDVDGNLPTLYDFLSHLERFLNTIVNNDPDAPGYSPSVRVGLSANGEISITNTSGTPINGLDIKSDRVAGSSSFITNAFRFSNSIPGSTPVPNPNYVPEFIPNPLWDGAVTGGTGVTVADEFMDNPEYDATLHAGIPEFNYVSGTSVSTALLIPAAETDLIDNVRNATGQLLGFEHGDAININGSVGGNARSGSINYEQGVTTMKDIIDLLTATFSLPPTDNTVFQRESVSIKQENIANDNIPLGAIVIRGQPELAFALTGLSVRGVDTNHQPPSPTRFNTNMAFTEVQEARNTAVHSTSLIVYDDAGAPHNVTMTFSHTGVPSEWIWEISVNGDERPISGVRGRLTFGIDGTPSSFTYDDDSGAFSFEPMNGASQVSINLNAGGPGLLTGITQFESPTTTVARDQNGFPMGKLMEISIDEKGEITGVYDSGITRSIAQIFVAEFNNPGGLMKMGDSMFAVSNNSGYPVMYQPGVGTTSLVKPGALEMSNVELETEFTNMITIQRGYQANARVITTSDQLLQELVQLVR